MVHPRAVILAAGRGSRMKDATDALPKAMLQLKGKPMIAHQVETLQKAGISEIGVVTGYRAETIAADGITQRFHNPRWQESNMLRSLMAASQWLTECPCIISYADIFYAPSGPESLMKSGADIALTYDVNFWELWSRRLADPLSDLENFRMNAGGFLTDIGGRAAAREAIEGQYMGLLFFSPQGWARISTYLSALPAAEVDRLDMTSLLKALISQGVEIKGIPYRDAWGEVDTQADLELYAS